MISIIVPVYKAESTLMDCVESLIAQTYENIEIILVDDGSPDKSGELCDSLAEEDSRIKVIHKENGGVSSARNAGIDAATGKYILFCDSDDVVEKDWCAEMYVCAEKYPEYIPMCGIRKLWNDGTEKLILLSEDCNQCERVTDEKYLLFDKIGLLYLAKNWLLNCPTNKLYRRDVIVEKGIRFDIGLSNGEDAEFNFRYISATSGQFAFVNEPLYKYLYFSETSLSHNEPLYGGVTTALHYNGFCKMNDALGMTDDNFRKDRADFYFNMFILSMKRCIADNKLSFFVKLKSIKQISALPEYDECLRCMEQSAKVAKIAKHKKLFALYMILKG